LGVGGRVIGGSVGGGRRHQRNADGRCGGEGRQGGGPPRPAGAGQLELLGGVVNGLGGDPGSGLVAVAGQISQHGVEASRTRRLPTVRELDLQATVGGPPQQLRVDLLDGADARYHQPVDPEGVGVGRCGDQAQPVSGGDGGLGGDGDGAGGEGAGVDLEGGGDLQLADPLDQADADRWPPPREDHGQPVRQIVWRPALRADLGGAVQRPARVGELLADPLGLVGTGQLLDQPQGAEYPRGHPGGGGEGAVLDIALAADPVHLGTAALQAPDARPVRGGPATVKQARGCQQPGAVAHAQQVGSPVAPTGDPLAQRCFLPAVGGGHGRDHDHVGSGAKPASTSSNE
jgi:hypothetical protein